MSESNPTPDQLRAKHAWEAVKAAQLDKSFDLFVGAARKLPVRIMASGLGQAIVFLKAKAAKKPIFSVLIQFITDWVRNQPQDGFPSKPLPKDDALLNAIITNGTADSLREMTAETLAYLQWLNRFCEATGVKEKSDHE